MPAEDLHGQRVWSRKMLLARATALEKQHSSTFTCSSRRNERKGGCSSTFNCLSREPGREPCQIPMGSQLQIPASSFTSWNPQITQFCAGLQETGTRKTLFAGHWVFQLLPYSQVKPWPVSQLYTCLQGFSCGKCRASSSCSFIRVAHTECPSFPKQLRFVRPWCIYMWEMTAIESEVQTLKEKGKEKLLFLRQSLKIIVKCRRNHFSLDVGFAVWSTWDPKANIKFFRWSLFMLPAQQQVSHNTRWSWCWACGNCWGYWCWFCF